jgi:DNA-binding response OmpR family regulator
MMKDSEIFDVVEATSALQGTALASQRAFVGVVCVWPLDEAQGGLDFLRFLRKNEKNVLIAVVADRVEQWGVREVLRAGADHYFTTSSDLDVVAAHMEIGIRGRAAAETKFRAGDLRVDVNRHQAWRGSREVSLTPIQFRLLVSLLEHVGDVVSKGVLFNEGWKRHDDPRGDSDHLVEVHLSELRKKLHASGEPILHTIHGVGYVLRPSDPNGGGGGQSFDADRDISE